MTKLKVLSLKGNCFAQMRSLSLQTFKEKLQHSSKMLAWQVHSYGDKLQLGDTRIPVLVNPSELLVRVSAASLNPIDHIMLGGYGRTLLNLFRKYQLEFPLTVGRDFAGIIVDKGHDVGGDFKIGDKVYGFVPLHKPGTHAEAVVVHKSHVRHQPPTFTPVQAASIPYAAMTAWSALYITGELLLRPKVGSRVLVLGASGGVGTLATQILKSQGVTVVGTCATDAVKLVQSLGATHVYDYTQATFSQSVASHGRYNIILDCAKFGYQNAPPIWDYQHYITLNSPLMVNTDQHGLFGGLATSVGDLIKPRMGGKAVRWGFFAPSEDGFKFIDGLVQTNQILPVIHNVVKFKDMPAAFEAMSAGHLRGKIVVDFD